MEQRIAELGLSRIPHPKHNYMPTGAGLIDSGFAEWSPDNPVKNMVKWYERQMKSGIKKAIQR